MKEFFKPEEVTKVEERSRHTYQCFVDDEGDDFSESTLSVETLCRTQVQMLGPTLVPSVSSIVRTVIVTSEKRSRLTVFRGTRI